MNLSSRAKVPSDIAWQALSINYSVIIFLFRQLQSNRSGHIIIMKLLSPQLTRLLAISAASVVTLSSTPVEGCSRVYQNIYDTYVSGRSMDWGFSFEDVLFLNPPGQEMDGNAGDRSVTWTSKYVSIQCHSHTCVCCVLVIANFSLSCKQYPPIHT